MEKFQIGNVLNNRYKIIGTYKVESGSILYKVEDIRFIGSNWLMYQIDISEYINSNIYINNLFSTLSFLSKIVYDKIGKIADFFIEKGYLIVVCEEINGTLLNELIHSSSINITKAVKLGLQLLEIVKFLYDKNIINFVDINPENIVIDRQGVVKILCFAVSKIPSIITEKGLDENKFIGTLGYIPPEMIDDDKVNIGQHTYIYIISSVIYEYITKLSPYSREDPFFFPPASSISPIIPNQISSLLEKCLSYNYNNRIKTFKEFEKKLLAILKSETEVEEPSNLNIFTSIIKNRAFMIIFLIIFVQFIIILILLMYYFFILL
ncbi:MAG: protein kinase [Candidatus Calescibacterium sp.]|nr:protein kinase [Candidatus Calescibacterium sp.]MCX7971842.1 protein kinase [bacterium]MDW8194957.1 protein kinase [Candidatus Calescibacterium sp.]